MNCSRSPGSTRLRNTLIHGVLLIAIAGVPGCWGNLGDSEVKGVVIHADTKQPIPNAVVVARWRGHRAGLVGGVSICYHAETAVSDQNGQFVVPAWEDHGSIKHSGRVSDKELELFAYKQGYDYVLRQRHWRATILMREFVGTNEEKARLLNPGYPCGTEDGSFRNLRPWFLAMLVEAETFTAQTRNSGPEMTLRYAIADIASY
jgi:hypothetical protein